MKKIYFLVIGTVLLSVFSLQLKAQCSGGRYHSLVFPGTPTVTSDVVYGNNLDQNGASFTLKLDVYRPACDTATHRPLIVFAHGGSFVSGDKADAGYAATAISLAQLGYVVASINYRLGFPTTGIDAAYGFNSAIMRGVHDAKAAIRFMRNNALSGGNTYGIDPTKIYFGGVSAGGIIALHLAYENIQSEMNMACNNQPGSECGSIEGTSNGTGSPINSVSSAVNAIISISGGIRDTTWIHSNDIPVCMAHGTVDGTVPYGSGTFGGYFPVFGSSAIAQRCYHTGTTYCFTPMIGQDHVPSNPAYVDTIATLMRNFMEHFMCNSTLSCAYNGSPSVLVPAVSIAITSGTNPTCGSSPVTFTATATNGGTNVAYQWKKNGVNVGTGATTYTLSAPAQGDVITCVLTTCASATTTTSNAITMTVSSSSAPVVTIAVTSGSNPTCTGQAITFTATPTNGGSAPTYQWKKGGTNVGTGATYTLSPPAANDVITCVMTSNSACANPLTATSNAITVTISSSVAPAVVIAVTSGSNPTCTGVALTFTATPTNGGNAPTYQWKKNGTNVGTGATYTLSSPTNNDAITCVMTSNSACANPTTATSNSITVTVSGSVAPTLSIAVTAGSNPSCAGASVTFTGTGTNGGTAPTYQWKKNGTNAATGSTYTSTTFANSDAITCVMTSNSACANPSTATSNSVTMTVNAIPTVTKTGNVLTSSATTGNQWNLNGQPLGGATAHTYTATAGGSYTVTVAGCTSLATTVTVTDVSELADNDHFLTVYPNPNSGNFNLSFTVSTKANYKLGVKNELGQLVYEETLTDFSGVYNHQIDVSKSGKGIYFISLSNGNHEAVKKVVVY